MKGVFFDLYGTLLIYGDMQAAWAERLTALYSRLIPFGLLASQEAFKEDCDRVLLGAAPTRSNDRLTIFESRFHALGKRFGLTLGEDDIALIADEFADRWERHVRMDEEAPAVLDTLGRHKVLALVSNFDHPRHVRKILSKYGLDKHFQSIVISGEVGVSKPDPRIFDLAVAQTGLSPSDVAYVGDTEEDVAAARAAGMLPIKIRRLSIAPRAAGGAPRQANHPTTWEALADQNAGVITVGSLRELLPMFL